LITATHSPAFEKATFDKAAWRLIPFLFLCYIVAFLDRVNVGFAKLQMAPDLKFSDAVYGFGAGIFFIGYFIFEVPSNVILERVGARIWIARIMITWGIISSAFMFTNAIHWGPIATMFNATDAEFTFYVNPSAVCFHDRLGLKHADAKPFLLCRAERPEKRIFDKLLSHPASIVTDGQSHPLTLPGCFHRNPAICTNCIARVKNQICKHALQLLAISQYPWDLIEISY